MPARSRVRKRKVNLKQAFKKIEQASQESSATSLDSNPKIAELELQMRGIAAVVKKEGIE